MTDETETTTAEEPQDISGLFDDDTRTDEGAEATEAEGESEQGETETEDQGETESPSQEPQEANEGESEQPEPEEAESEPPSDSEGESVPRQALLDERRKRQEAQEALERFKREQGIQQEDDEAPDPRDDPEGYEKHVRQKVERENWEKRVTTSRERMLEKHADFEEKERHFVQLAQQSPDLVKQMNEHPDPAAFAYEKAQEDLSSKEKAVEDRVIERLRKEGRLKDESQERETKSSKAAESASRVADLTSSAGAGNNSSDQIQESADPQDVFDDLGY